MAAPAASAYIFGMGIRTTTDRRVQTGVVVWLMSTVGLTGTLMSREPAPLTELSPVAATKVASAGLIQRPATRRLKKGPRNFGRAPAPCAVRPCMRANGGVRPRTGPGPLIRLPETAPTGSRSLSRTSKAERNSVALSGRAGVLLILWPLLIVVFWWCTLGNRCMKQHAMLSRVAGECGGAAGWWWGRPTLYVPLAGVTQKARMSFDLNSEFTTFCAPVRPGSEHWTLAVQPRSVLGWLTTPDGLKELRVGYAEIDDRFAVKSDNMIQAALYFGNAETRGAWLALAKLHGDSPIELAWGEGSFLGRKEGYFLVRKIGYLDDESSAREFLRICLELHRAHFDQTRHLFRRNPTNVT